MVPQYLNLERTIKLGLWLYYDSIHFDFYCVESNIAFVV